MIEIFIDEQVCVDQLRAIRWKSRAYCFHCGRTPSFDAVDAATTFIDAKEKNKRFYQLYSRTDEDIPDQEENIPSDRIGNFTKKVKSCAQIERNPLRDRAKSLSQELRILA